MAGMDDFFKALGMFQEATKDYAVKQGINDATQAVQQINQSLDIDINQKFAQQQAISKQLATQLTGLGAPQSAIATAVSAIAPPDITTVEGARQLAAMATTPDEQLKYAKVAEENAAKLGQLSLATKKPQLEQEQKFQADEKQKDRQLQWDIARLQNNKMLADKTKEAKAGEVSFATNLQMAGNFINELKSAVTESGTYESDWLGNEKNAAILKQTPYKLAITYAKIVDPESVAREGEVAAAQKYLIELGATKNKKAVLAQIDQMAKTINEYKAGRQIASGKPINVPDIKTTPERQNKNPVATLKVRLANGKTGQIRKEARDKFLADNPGAVIIGE